MRDALIYRVETLWRILVVVLAIFVSKIFYLQIVRGNSFKALALRNRFQIFYRQAPRGRLFDAKGLVIAGNVGVFNIYFNPNLETNNFDDRVSYLAKILHLKLESLKAELEETRQLKKTRAIFSQVPTTDALRFLEAAEEFPEFFLASESLRLYPLGEDLSHLVGYLTKIQSRQEYENLKSRGYRFDSWVGQFALERNFEDLLRGTDGAVFIEVDAHGRIFHPKIEEHEIAGVVPKFNQEPYPGADLFLTLDASLSQLAHKLLRGSPSGKGSVVGLDPETGAVLVFAAVPGFDPNSYIRLDKKRQTQAHEFPRALTGVYPPGSIFKIITALAALEAPSFDVKREFRCRGSFPTPKRIFKCWKAEGHGSCDFYAGVQFSCDVYFYHLGLMLGPTMANWAKKFSLGKSLGIRELPQFETRGFVPTPELRKATRQGWFAGDSLNMAIGQGELLATPLQLACLISLAAKRGVLYQPYLLEEIRDPQTQKTIYKSQAHGKILIHAEGVSQSSWEAMEKALALVVEKGTGRGAKIPGYRIYGKTGTAENPLGEDHALFVCYLKDANGRPRLALSVIVDHGGQGSAAAVPVAREILRSYINNEAISPIQPS